MTSGCGKTRTEAIYFVDIIYIKAPTKRIQHLYELALRKVMFLMYNGQMKQADVKSNDVHVNYLRNQGGLHMSYESVYFKPPISNLRHMATS